MNKAFRSTLIVIIVAALVAVAMVGCVTKVDGHEDLQAVLQCLPAASQATSATYSVQLTLAGTLMHSIEAQYQVEDDTTVYVSTVEQRLNPDAFASDLYITTTSDDTYDSLDYMPRIDALNIDYFVDQSYRIEAGATTILTFVPSDSMLVEAKRLTAQQAGTIRNAKGQLEVEDDRPIVYTLSCDIGDYHAVITLQLFYEEA